jgi:UPF0176 protein
MQYRIITFYKYTSVPHPDKLRSGLLEFCTSNNILGRILIGEEGINGAICGRFEVIEEFKNWIHLDSSFSDLTFRQHDFNEQAYHKLVVRVRKEIVHFGKDVDITKTGKYVMPDELNKMLDDHEEVVLIDARNDYEAKAGKFKGAIVFPIKTFREFPEKAKELGKFKQKKIIMYCTGGIRCEKASAYMKQIGFSDVSHLKGGIIDYLDKYPKSHFKGNCFVFDDRLVADTGGEPASECEICGTPTIVFINCHNLECDTLFICCEMCQKKMKKCCCTECKESPRQRKEKKILKTIGVVENYFTKPSVAQIKLKSIIRKDHEFFFSGRTTKEFMQKITDMKDESGNNIISAEKGKTITIKVNQKVRKNDLVMVDIKTI